MKFIHDDLEEMGKLVGYTQFLIYTDVNRQGAKKLGDRIWMDMKSMFGHYHYGSRHTIAIPALSEPIDYTVAMIPMVSYVDCEGFREKVLQQLIYLVRSEVFPLLEDVDPEELGRWY